MKKVNKKKKVTVIALSVVALIAGIYFLQNRNSNGMENTSQVTKNADVGVSAKTDSYESVGELEEDADLIVRGVKVKQNDPVITYAMATGSETGKVTILGEDEVTIYASDKKSGVVGTYIINGETITKLLAPVKGIKKSNITKKS